ncbi:hypothetical protein EDB83DRAFT_2315867 [Lactarius deliciosus]|nr:hypothetical protein EDB83DRAFT_2315867 [Lactarius deliciosus]
MTPATLLYTCSKAKKISERGKRDCQMQVVGMGGKVTGSGVEVWEGNGGSDRSQLLDGPMEALSRSSNGKECADEDMVEGVAVWKLIQKRKGQTRGKEEEIDKHNVGGMACMRQGGGPALCQGGVMAGLVVEGSCAVAVAIVFMVSMLPGRCHRRWALACHIGNGKLGIGQGFARQSGGGGLAYGEGWMEVAMTRWLCSINQKQYKYSLSVGVHDKLVGHAQWWVVMWFVYLGVVDYGNSMERRDRTTRLWKHRIDGDCGHMATLATLPMGKAETQVRLAKVVEPDVNALMAYVAIMPEYCQLEGMLVKALV